MLVNGQLQYRGPITPPSLEPQVNSIPELLKVSEAQVVLSYESNFEVTLQPKTPYESRLRATMDGKTLLYSQRGSKHLYVSDTLQKHAGRATEPTYDACNAPITQ